MIAYYMQLDPSPLTPLWSPWSFCSQECYSLIFKSPQTETSTWASSPPSDFLLFCNLSFHARDGHRVTVSPMPCHAAKLREIRPSIRTKAVLQQGHKPAEFWGAPPWNMSRKLGTWSSNMGRRKLLIEMLGDTTPLRCVLWDLEVVRTAFETLQNHWGRPKRSPWSNCLGWSRDVNCQPWSPKYLHAAEGPKQ